LTIVVGYDTDVPGSVAGGNTSGLDAAATNAVVDGVAVFTVPFTDAGQQYGWNAPLDPVPTDLSGKELVVRLRLVSGFTNVEGCTVYGGVQLYAFSSSDGTEWDGSLNGWSNIGPDLYGEWQDFTLDLDAESESFDPVNGAAIGYTFNTGGRAEDAPADCVGATEAVFEIDYVALRDKVAEVPMGTGGSPDPGGAGAAPSVDGGAGGAGGSGAGANTLIEAGMGATGAMTAEDGGTL
jgi:hypothetical protein